MFLSLAFSGGFITLLQIPPDAGYSRLLITGVVFPLFIFLVLEVFLLRVDGV